MTEDDGDSAGEIRAFLQRVAVEFKRLSRTRGSEAVLEPADAGASFRDDVVRAKFRIKKRRDLDAAGVIVTAADDDPVPDCSPSDVARAILQLVEGLEDMRKGSVVRLSYPEVPLSEVLQDIG
jgi:hypothetical protein